MPFDKWKADNDSKGSQQDVIMGLTFWSSTHVMCHASSGRAFDQGYRSDCVDRTSFRHNWRPLTATNSGIEIPPLSSALTAYAPVHLGKVVVEYAVLPAHFPSLSSVPKFIHRLVHRPVHCIKTTAPLFSYILHTHVRFKTYLHAGKNSFTLREYLISRLVHANQSPIHAPPARPRPTSCPRAVPCPLLLT